MLVLVLAAALQSGSQAHFRAILSPDASSLQRFVEWRHTPTSRKLDEVYPVGQHGRLGAALECRVKSTGKLTDCDVWTTYPKDRAVRIAALSLVPDFQITPEFTKAAVHNNAKVAFDIIFEPPSDEGAGWADGDCPPPFCIPVPPPPPDRH